MSRSRGSSFIDRFLGVLYRAAFICLALAAAAAIARAGTP